MKKKQVKPKKSIFALCIIFPYLAFAVNSSALSHFVPEAHSPQCLIDTKENIFTSQDCIENSANFFDDPDKTIAFFLNYYAHWSKKDVQELLSIKKIDERYSFFLKHNKSNFKLECNKGFVLPKKYQHCQQPLFGNLFFQIDYLLCPNLIGRYSILTARQWSERLNDLFVYCAGSSQLARQCSNAPIVLATKQSALKKDTYTLTSKEICQLSSVYGFKIIPVNHSTRYHVYLLTKHQSKK